MLGKVSALAASLCWAIGPLVAYRGVEVLGTFRFAQARFLVATVGLFALAAANGVLPSLSTPGLPLLIMSGVIGIAIGEAALFQAVYLLGPRRASLLYVLNAPIVAVLGSSIFHERISALSMLGVVAVFAGVMTAIYYRNPHEADTRSNALLRRGFGCALLAALCQAVGVLLVKGALVSVDPIEAATVRTLAAAIAFIPLFVVFRERGGNISGSDMRYVGYSAVISTIGGMTFSLFALAHTNIAYAAVLSSLSPVILILILRTVKAQRFPAGAWVGTVLAVIGVVSIVIGRA